jgi:hypothetical protein
MTVQTNQMSLAVHQLVALTLTSVKKLNSLARQAISVFFSHGFVTETTTVRMPAMNHTVSIKLIFILNLLTR